MQPEPTEAVPPEADTRTRKLRPPQQAQKLYIVNPPRRSRDTLENLTSRGKYYITRSLTRNKYKKWTQ